MNGRPDRSGAAPAREAERDDPDTAEALARALTDVAAPHVSGVVLFGSHLAGSSPGSHSAYDFVVVVDAYRLFYRALVESGHHRRSPRTLAALARVLPPNVVPFEPGDLPGEPVAKCMVVTGQHFERALSPDSRDHFLKGRMVQTVEVVYARDRRTRAWLEDVLAGARASVLRWVGPHLEGSFTAEELARRMLRVSYRGEVRPEAGDRVEEVFEAQREELRAMYEEVLSEAARRGEVEREADGRYRLAEEPGFLARAGNRLYFARSKVRATARWPKHVLTYPDWLSYIQRKVERRTGMKVELTERERKYPALFLWPRVFRVLRARPANRSAASAAGGPDGGDSASTGPDGHASTGPDGDAGDDDR